MQIYLAVGVSHPSTALAIVGVALACVFHLPPN